jgi:hypothetical protein
MAEQKNVNTTIKVANTRLYQNPNILLKAPTIDCDASDLDNPATAAGINIIADKDNRHNTRSIKL